MKILPIGPFSQIRSRICNLIQAPVMDFLESAEFVYEPKTWIFQYHENPMEISSRKFRRPIPASYSCFSDNSLDTFSCGLL